MKYLSETEHCHLPSIIIYSRARSVRAATAVDAITVAAAASSATDRVAAPAAAAAAPRHPPPAAHIRMIGTEHILFLMKRSANSTIVCHAS